MNYLKINFPLLALFLLNVAVKCLFLSHESLSHDEPFSVYHAQFDFPQLVTYLKAYNNPPLYEIILHFWIRICGISEVSVRLPAMLFSCISVVFIYRIGKDFFNHRVALLSALIFTFSTMQTWYAHDSRVYSLFLLLTLISFYSFFKLLNSNHSKGQLIVLLLANVLIIYAHYFGFFVWFIEFLTLIFYHRKDHKLVLRYLSIHALATLLYSPQIVTLYQRFSESSAKGTWLKAPIGLESLYNMIWSFTNAPVVAVLSILILATGLANYVLSKREAINRFTAYVIVWFFVPYFLMFILSYKIPMFLDRYLIFITPAFYLLLAISIHSLFQKRIAYLSAAGLLLVFFAFSFSANPSKKRAVRETVDFIKSRKDSKTLVLICPAYFNTTFAYYYNRNAFKNIHQESEYRELTLALQADDVYFINAIDQAIIDNINRYEKIIYLDAGADFANPGNTIKKDLVGQFRLTEQRSFPESFHLYLFKSH